MPLRLLFLYLIASSPGDDDVIRVSFDRIDFRRTPCSCSCSSYHSHDFSSYSSMMMMMVAYGAVVYKRPLCIFHVTVVIVMPILLMGILVLLLMLLMLLLGLLEEARHDSRRRPTHCR
jgi:hypothetical protein